MTKQIQIGFLIILCSYGIWSGDWLYAKWVPVTLFGAACLCAPLWRISAFGAMAIFYSLANGLINALSTFGAYSASPDFHQVILRGESLKAVTFLSALTLMAMNFDNIKKAASWLWLVCIVASVWSIISFAVGGFPVIYGAYAGKSTTIGMSFNRSLSATFIALTFPFLLKKFPPKSGLWPIYLLPIGAAIFSKGVIGFFAMVGAIIAWDFAFQRKARILIIPVILIGTAYLFLGPDLWQFSGRLEIWDASLRFMNHFSENQVFGFGLGTFFAYGVSIREFFHLKTDDVFLTLHNDYLQCFFELGMVGVCLWFAFFIQTAWRAFNQSAWQFAALASICISMFGNYPARMGEQAFVIAVIFGSIWTKQGDKCQDTLSSQPNGV